MFWQCLSGLLAATAILIKPHYALVPILLEIHLFFHTRDIRNLFRAENYTIATMGLAWLIGTALTMPEAFSKELPGITRFYWTYSAPWKERFSALQVVICIALLSSLRIRLAEAASRIRTMMLLAIAGCYLAFLLLGNSWLYRQLPFLGLSWLYGWSIFLYKRSQVYSTENREQNTRGGIAATHLALLLVIFIAAWQQSGLLSRIHQWVRGGNTESSLNIKDFLLMKGALSELPEINSMLVLDTELFPHTLFMMQYGIEWPSRYNSLWMLPAWEKTVQGEVTVTEEERKEMENFMVSFHDRFAEDLRAGLPDVILVDISKLKPIFGTASFDYIPYFQKHVPYFRQVWPQYVFFKSVHLGNQREIAIYHRKP
jgi:hypothetical protein